MFMWYLGLVSTASVRANLRIRLPDATDDLDSTGVARAWNFDWMAVFREQRRREKNFEQLGAQSMHVRTVAVLRYNSLQLLGR